MAVSITDFFKLRNNHPLIDVRSEGEYVAGHIPGAINVPLLNNEERIVVGTTYKQSGQQSAIREGFRLVGPRLRDIIETTEKIANGNEILVHCWRGGMRSNNFCQFAGMAGITSQALTGGYKAYRQVAVESYKSPLKIVVLTGCTGSGKSEVLRELKAQGEQIVDLEGIAHHKGSAFGGLLMPPQPTTEQFQNNLFEEIQKLDLSKRVWMEDESIAIGKIFLPTVLWQAMHGSPLVMMDVGKDVRIQRLVDEYGNANREEFLAIMAKISKKLGGQNFNAAKEKLLLNDMHAVMEILLTYYDKAYLNSIHKREKQIKLSLNWKGDDIKGYAKELIKLQD